MSKSVKAWLCYWAAPLTAVLIGIGYSVAELVAGFPAAGIFVLGFSFLIALCFGLAARRSETVRGLMDRRDERIVGIDVRATAAVGSLLIIVILVAGMVETAHGRSGAPYTWLAAVAGGGYIVAVAVERARR